jgi:hypothetical protein
MAKRTYTREEKEAAKEFIELLRSFSNYDLQCVCNHKVTDKTRMNTIIEIVVSEYGADIMNAGVMPAKMYAEHKLNF